MTALCTVGFGGLGVKDAYGADKKPNRETEIDIEWKVEIEIKGKQGGTAKVVDVESREVVVPAKLHGHKIELPARLYRPKWNKAVKPGPAILLLHGSGGLEQMPKGKDDEPCSSKLAPQYTRWGKRLAELGYVVLMPSSYSARGFCDMHHDTERIPETFDERPEAVLSRLYDVDAASRYLCDRPEVDCDRMGVMGFSHGATMTMMALHWQIDHAIERYRERNGHKVDIELPDLKPGRPEFQVGVAYYPGCGTDGVLPMYTDEDSSVYNKYFPTANLFILHASDDPLIEFCSLDYGEGQRELQSEQVAAHLGVDSPYHVRVYENAGHSFDSGGEKGQKRPGDDAARDKALKVALKQIHRHLN